MLPHNFMRYEANHCFFPPFCKQSIIYLTIFALQQDNRIHLYPSFN